MGVLEVIENRLNKTIICTNFSIRRKPKSTQGILGVYYWAEILLRVLNYKSIFMFASIRYIFSC
jgi:hypothetical protein